MQIVIRPAIVEDWPVIVAFNCDLAQESEGKQLNREHVEPGVQALLIDPRKGRYQLALVGGRIVGQLMHTYEWSDWRNGDIWWIESVYVHADHRGRGVFAALVAWFSLASILGCDVQRRKSDAELGLLTA